MKRARKVLVGFLAMVMIIGTCMSVSAAGTVASIKAISAKQENAKGQVKNVSGVTVYTNDTNKPIEISYTWDKKTDETAEPVGVKVSSSNRGVVKVNSELSDISSSAPAGKSNTVTTTGKIVLTPVANGKATITVTDKLNKKKVKKINVTVKTYASDIAFSDSVEVEKAEDKEDNYTITVAEKGKRNLGAYITNDSSDKKLKYKLENVSPAKGVTVDGKGNVSIKKEGASATVVVTSNDKKVEKKVNVVSKKETVTSIAVVKDTNTNANALGLLNKKSVLNLKANETSDANTYQLICQLNKGASVKDLSFVSDKTNVATVDENGKITAVGNGTAVITVSPKLGNNKSAKITVKVTTDADIVTVAKTSFHIIANNKDTAKLAGATNTNASNKTVLYSIVSVKDAQTGDIISNTNDIKKYVSVDKKGNVKAKKPCSAIIRAYAKANTSAERMVTVTASVPVDKITLASADASQPQIAKNKVTVYKTGADEQQTLTLKATAAAKETGTTPGNTKVTWKSSKPAIAAVDENGNVTALSNGSSVITATAADGSGKKASVTVTVKTDAYEIQIAKAQKVEGKDIIYLEGEEGKAKAYKSASVIKAATNINASNKKVNYSETSVSLKPGEEKEITVTAADTRTHGTEIANAVTKTVTLKCVDKSLIARSYEMNVSESSVQMIAGEATEISAVVTPEAGKYAEDLTGVTWKSKAAGIASVKNGVITAKKAGNTTVTVTYKYNGYKNEEDAAKGKITKNLTISKTIDVYVGRKTADVQKDVNNAFTAELKAENRDYTGISTTFEAKNNHFVLNILEPSKDFTLLKETGLVEAVEGLVKDAALNYKKIAITDTETGDTWEIERNGITVSVFKNGDTELTNAQADDAIAYVLKNTVGSSKYLKDWNGKQYMVSLAVEETRSEGSVSKTYSYDLYYTIDVVMSENLYKQQIDETIEENLTGLSIDGIENITYKNSSNTIEVIADNASQSITEADKNARAAVVAALEEVFEDAQSATIAVETPLGTSAVTKSRTETNSTAEFINSLLDEYVEKLSGRVKTFGELDGSIAALQVTYKVGAMEYSQSYKVNFYLGEKAFDNAADKAIAEALAGKEFVFGKVSYSADENTLSVDFNEEYAQKAPEELAGTGLVSVLDSMAANSSVDKEKEMIVIVDGVVSTVKASEGTTNILTKLTEGIEKLVELDGRNVIIKVPYKAPVGENDTVLVYNIKFTAEEAVVSDGMAEETEEETVTEETTEEMTTEEETVTEESTEETTTEESTEETTTEEESEAEEPTEETTTEEESEAEEPTEETTTEEETAAEESTEEMTTEEETTAEEVIEKTTAEETIEELSVEE